MSQSIMGNCLCGNVSYNISQDLGDIIHCHCPTCRKAHGAAFSSVAAIKDINFKISGSEHLKSFESSMGKHRHFCSNCGSQIYAKREGTDFVILRLGSLNDESLLASGNRYQEAKHIWLSQKACWYQLDSKIEQFPEF
ncbi:MAG: GFA family protein [Oleispira sp.]|nr:GFA family protein [Oleispira sp.]